MLVPPTPVILPRVRVSMMCWGGWVSEFINFLSKQASPITITRLFQQAPGPLGSLTWMFLECGRKLDYPKKTHANMKRMYKLCLHRQIQHSNQELNQKPFTEATVLTTKLLLGGSAQAETYIV